MSKNIRVEYFLKNLNYPEKIVHSYTRIGIEHLYDWQYECLNLNGVNKYFYTIIIIYIHI